MILENYKPRYNRTLVYVPSTNNIIEQMNGIVSVCTLAILNDYSFVIKGIEKSHLSDIFQSNLDWWDKSWLDTPCKKGLWNLNRLTEVDLFDLSHIHIEKKFPYSEVIYTSTNLNLVPHLMKSEVYKERIEYLGLGSDESPYLEILKNLFTEFEGDFQTNYEMLLEDFTNTTKRGVMRIVNLEKAQSIVEEVNEKKLDKVLLSTNDFKIRDFLKENLNCTVLTIPEIESEDLNAILLLNLKLSYELFLFLTTEIRYVDENDEFSSVVQNTATQI